MLSQQESAAVQAASHAMTVNYILIVSLVLIAYDSLLTLFEEMPYIWQEKRKLGTALYLLARYSMLLLNLVETIYFLCRSISLQTCNALVHFDNFLFIPNLIGIQGLLLARAYAVTAHKRQVLAVLGLLSVCTIGPELAAAILVDCDLTSAQLHALEIVDDVTTFSVILFDTIVVVVTLAGTLGTWRVYKKSTWDGMTLKHLLAKQGLMRFGFVLTMTVADAILPLILKSKLYGIFSPIQNSLSTIIICHFHLDLQRTHAHLKENVSQDLPTISIGSFRAASQRMHDAVMSEFGGPLVDESVETEASREDSGPDIPTEMTERGIELEEFQSRTRGAEITDGCLGHLELDIHHSSDRTEPLTFSRTPPY